MTDQTSMNSAEAAILDTKLEHVVEGMRRQDLQLAEVLRAVNVLPLVQAQLADVKESMGKGSSVMADHEKRIQTLEKEMPALKEVRTWVIAGVLGCVAMVGGVVFKFAVADRQTLVIQDKPAPRPTRTMV